MKRLKIGIRTQLIILVAFSSLFSLLILGIVTGVYFSSNLTNLQAERLELVSNLKLTQVKQAIQYIEYQIYFLSTRDTLAIPLESYRAGNYSSAVFDDAESTIQQFLDTSETFAAARLYDLSLNEVVDYYNNASNIPTPTLDYLYPLKKNASIPSPLTDTDPLAIPTYISGPIANDSSNIEGTYYMGVTIPVYSNNSIILDEPYVAGYLSVIADTSNVQYSLKDVSIVDSSLTNYTIAAFSPIYINGANTSQTEGIVAFDLVFPVDGMNMYPGIPYSVNDSEIAQLALYQTSGSSTNVKDVTGENVAIGYSKVEIDSSSFWSIIILEKRSSFLSPIKKLQNIIIGVVIGIAVFICLITFPLAMWFIRPITKLKEATEAITNFKKKKPSNTEKLISPLGSTNGNPSSPSQSEKRNSFTSYGSSTGNSIYSSGIRLPRRIPNSKKFFKDELTELTEAFNIMTEELDKQYTYLEDRVKLRTRELEASKIEAEKANEAKTVFIANISHELRTPLNGILGMTSIAMDEKDHSIIQDSLKLIHRSGELLLHILTELLTYSKNTLNRSKLEKSNFQILEIVYQVKSIFSKIALDQRVKLKIMLRPSIIRQLILYGDSNRIIQILMNLVSNSMKFTPIDGSIDVTFKLLGEYDYERSKKENFSKVYIKENKLSIPNENDEEPKIKQIEENDNVVSNIVTDDNDDSDQVSTNTRITSNSSKEDSISISTLSTTEYQNQLFNSQFHYTKPLPNIPSISTTSSDPTAIISDEGSNLDRVSSSHSETLHKHNKEDNYNSKMSNNELVKNNKSFKLRHIYKPKTWVLQFQVTDTGPGIEPALHQKVFEPFIQGDQSLSRSHGGTGLGLSICMQLAKMMNGTLTLKSTVGVGSTFTFTVPLSQTGEIIVKPEDLEEFCDDEFNPNSKINRKVAFDENIISNSDKESSSVNDNSEDQKIEFHDALDKNIQESETVQTESLTQPQSENLKPPSFEIVDQSSFSSNISTHNNTKVSELSTHSSNSKNFRLDLSKETVFEKPMLLAVSSTGTASSSRKNFINDVKNINILVAEDNMVNQEVIKRMLRLEGFDAITMASNGAEAIDFVKTSMEEDKYYDLIFMDVQMPQVDGLQATRTIRNDLHFMGPIIALTAFADESNVKECINCGMSGFLSKPIKRTNLRQIILNFCPDMLGDFVSAPKQHGEEKTLGHVSESN